MARNTRIEPHGEYIHDFSLRTPPLCERKCHVEEREAIALLRESPFVNRAFDTSDVNWFRNKGFAVLSVADGAVTILFRHAERWSLWSATEANACVMCHVASLDELRVA